MKLYTIHSGYFKLDGGAMFGVVPKVIWNKLNPADSNNLCTWAMRLLLMEDGNRLILIDTGLGNKQSEKFFSHYEPSGDNHLEKSLGKLGFGLDEITDVILTHLHFDHCGGAVSIQNEKLVPTFKNAIYWSNEKHFEWALHPNPRERASFLKENFEILQSEGRVQYVADGDRIGENMYVRTVNGHTEQMLIPHIEVKDKTLVYMADLIPSYAHIPVPYVMGYDIRPLDCLKERSEFLERGLENNHVLFFEHDPQIECCSLIKTEKGIRGADTFALSELF